MIGITHVLNEINTPVMEGQTNVFSIAFVRTGEGRGGTRGTTKRVEKACKYIAKDSPNTGKRTYKSPNLKLKRILRLYDMKTNRPFNLFLYTIIEFNGQTVRH